MMQTTTRAVILALAQRISFGELTVHEGGRTHVLGPGGPPSATIEIRSPRAWPMFAGGRRRCLEAYREGLWDSPDLVTLFRVAVGNITKIDSIRRPIAFVRAPWQRRNTPTRSRRDISAHYDLGNELFSLMLDPAMMYSCAIFEHPESTLQQAQLRKLEMVCEKLNLGPGDRVIEIGSGWGGFAIHAATTRGCHVTATTISAEQHHLAIERVRGAGVQHLVDVRLDDYREVRGTYDKLVSLEMIEAVGHKDFGNFFACCSNLLAPHGTMLLQAITIDDRAYDISKISRSFMRTYMFPNGCLPCPRAIADSIARRTDMRTVHLEDFTPHYAETLRRWRANIDAVDAELELLGYDEYFRRLWQLYLAYCEAGFEERLIAVVQMVMAKPRHRIDRSVWSRTTV